MIDPQLAREAPTITSSIAWSVDDVILYQLGLGAGDRPNDPRQVRYVYEEQLVVLPTFAAVPASSASSLALSRSGLALDLHRVLHVEQELEIFQPIPPSAEATNSARIERITERGRDAFIVVAVETSFGDGTRIALNRFHLLARGAGGLGDRAGNAMTRAKADLDGPPDRVVVTRTLPQQAAWFRLSSDRTPVHVDPAAATAVGLERPSLQGLCTWGIIGKMLIDEVLDGEPSTLRTYRARFTGMVFPGETLESAIRIEGDTIRAEVTVQERRTPAMSVLLRI